MDLASTCLPVKSCCVFAPRFQHLCSFMWSWKDKAISLPSGMLSIAFLYYMVFSQWQPNLTLQVLTFCFLQAISFMSLYGCYMNMPLLPGDRLGTPLLPRVGSDRFWEEQNDLDSEVSNAFSGPASVKPEVLVGEVLVTLDDARLSCVDQGLGVYKCSYLITEAQTLSVILRVNGQPVNPVSPHTFALVINPKPIDSTSGAEPLEDVFRRFLWVMSEMNLEMMSRIKATTSCSVKLMDQSKRPRPSDPPLDAVRYAPGLFRVNLKLETTGVHKVNCYALNKGGINARYFNNRWVEGVPAISQVDTAIDFNWGEGLVTADSSDYASAQFDGYLQVPTAANYTFYITCDDGANLWIDDELVLSQASAGQFQTRPILLTGARLYHLQVMYYERTGFARMRLEWSSDQGLVREVIGKDSWFHSRYLAGVTVDALVQLRDQFGNNRTSSSTSLLFQGRFGPSTLAYTDHNDGTVTVKVGTHLAGQHPLQITLAGVQISNTPTPEIPVNSSLAKYDGTDCAIPAQVTAGIQSLFQCFPRDTFGNKVVDNDIFIEAEFVNMDDSSAPVVTVAGTYSLVDDNYDFPLQINKVGAYSVVTQFWARGGLIGRYYRTPGFQSLVSLLTDRPHQGLALFEYTRVDPQLNIIWPESPVATCPEDYYSVHWHGYLLPKATGLHNIRIEADRGARVMVGSAWVIDEIASDTAVRASAQVTLTNHVPEYIEVQYKHSAGTAYVRLYWVRQHFAVLAERDMSSAQRFEASRQFAT
ncbi:unnamed protein product [Durusdinium trenchii]|uniref:PA14 domain-containing protein n=1 Tax=Durusdinium trenchii TaxID=1381693 RepID=A0ABP0PBK5_9DINO